MENRRSDIPQISGTEQIFTGIGRIRVSTADPQPGMVIIFVLFEYNSGDRPFSEELALRVGEFRNIIREYVGSFSATELQQLSEETIKAELLRRFNQILRLGRIETLYFNDFMILG
jgi:flagellar basal body-associated protein FliL